MILLPIAAAIVALVFSVSTWRASQGGSLALRVWSVALLQFAVASGALAWAVGFGWTPVAYRMFYLFGAVLNVAWLALGTLWLIGSVAAGRLGTAVVVGLSLLAATVVLLSPLLPGGLVALAASGIPRAAEVMPAEVRVLSRVYSIAGSVVVLGGLIVSLVRRRNVAGLSLLTLGVVVVAVASEVARQTDRIEVFSAGLAGGVTLMYVGFLRTRPRASSV